MMEIVTNEFFMQAKMIRGLQSEPQDNGVSIQRGKTEVKIW